MQQRYLSPMMCWLVAVPLASADVVNLPASRDGTLYEDAIGMRANGAGQFLYAGQTDALNSFFRDRAVLAFDIAGHIPAGATINSAALTLHVSKVRFPPTAFDMSVHRLTADWGEGASDAGAQVPFTSNWTAPAANDTTWFDTFFGVSTWANPGGDFAPAPSDTQSVGDVAFYTWSSAQLAADVQDMLDNPAGDDGWILIGDEIQPGTAKQLNSREHVDPALRPVLTVDFDPPAGIPTIGQWGLTVMTLLFLVGGTVIMARRWTPVPAEWSDGGS